MSMGLNEPADYTETVAVFAAPDESTAEIVRGMLEGEGIPAVIGEQVSSAFAGALAIGESFWGEVRVNAADTDRARALVEAAVGGLTETEEAALTAEAESSTDPMV